MTKYIKDILLTSDSAAVKIDGIDKVLTSVLIAERARWASGAAIPIQVSLPATAADGSELWTVAADAAASGLHDATELRLSVSDQTRDAIASSAIAIVAIWDTMAPLTYVAAKDGGTDAAPVTPIKAIYILAMPELDDIATTPAMADYVTAVLSRDVLAKARTIAKRLQSGAEGYSLHTDKASLLLSALPAPKAVDGAFIRLLPWLQALFMAQADLTAKRLAALGRHADASLVRSTFSRARLSKETLRACLSSQASAERYFAGMVNTDEARGPRGMQWDAILAKLIERAPKHKVKRGTGKEAYEVAAPQSAAIFKYWLDTRYSAVDEGQATEVLGLDFSEVEL